jgi:hypothetical protein
MPEMIWQDTLKLLTTWEGVAEFLGLPKDLPPPPAVTIERMLLDKLPKGPGRGGGGDAGGDGGEGDDGCGTSEDGGSSGGSDGHGMRCVKGQAPPTAASELDRARLRRAVLDANGEEALKQAAHGASPTGALRYRKAIRPRVRPVRISAIERIMMAVQQREGHRFESRQTFLREGRYPLLPGRCTLPAVSVAVCVDSSGSISDEQTRLFTGVIKGSYPDAVFCEFTTEVIPHGDQWRGRTASGGTLFGPPLEWARKQEPDVVVMMTDGMPADQGTPQLRAPIIWVMPKGCQLHGWTLRPRDTVVVVDPEEQGCD